MKLGEIKTNNKGEEFKILSKSLDKSTKKHTYYDIMFLKSRFKDCVRGDSINKGLVKNKLSISCCGVGIIGYINTRDFFHEYKIWENMMYRCYCESDKSYKYYGGKGVVVCEKWHRFDLFLQDIKFISGFDQLLFDEHKLRLDKDILSNDSKIYSLESTMWVSDLENQKQRTKEYNIKHKKYVIFPDGHIEQLLNISDFCKTYGLHRQNVTLCLSGKQKSTKGFRFYKE